MYAKAKFIERSGCGTDWKNVQFLYIISSINAFLYEIDCFLQHYYSTLENILTVLATLNDCISLYSCGNCFILNEHDNYNPISTIETDDTRLLKQRSPKWFEIRKTAKVTGSTIWAALGLDGLEKMQEHFDQVLCDIKPMEPSAEEQSLLDFGAKHEIYAVATLVGKI